MFDIAALMLNGVLLVIFYLRRFYHTISGEIYKIMLWLNFVAASCDLATAFTNCDLSLIPLWLNYIINVGYILSHNLTSIVFLVYVISAIRGNIGNRPEKILNVCYKLFGHQAIYIRANHDFALFLEQDKVEETIKRIDEAFEEPLTVNDTDVRLTMNYCVLRHPGLTDSAAEINEVLRTTIMSMRHKSGQRIAEVKQALVDKNRREEQIIHLLRDALKNDGFAVYFQPILDVRTGRFRSAEALLRLKKHGDRLRRPR